MRNVQLASLVCMFPIIVVSSQLHSRHSGDIKNSLNFHLDDDIRQRNELNRTLIQLSNIVADDRNLFFFYLFLCSRPYQ